MNSSKHTESASLHESIQISPEWLTHVLHRSGTATHVKVSSVEILASKKLQVSTVYRLSINYDTTPVLEGAPKTLFLKLSSLGSDSDPLLGKAEVDFYHNVAPAIGAPPLFRCFDAVYSADSGESQLLLEDLSDTHSQPDENNAPSAAMINMAVAALGKVHAQYWSSPVLGKGIGRIFDQRWLDGFIADLERGVGQFVDCADLTADEKRRYAALVASASRIWGRLTDRAGLTVTHGDLHWWNFLYPIDTALDTVRLFDWQLWHIDLGARDLAFLLALGGFADPRPDLEQMRLDVYHAALLESGVTGYTRAMLDEDYRWSAIRNLNIPVIFWKQGKHEPTWRTALRRAFGSFDRLGCMDLIA